MDLNRATIIGRVTRDPEVRTTPNGQTVSTIGIATNRTWTDQQGVKQERADFHNCVLWGKLAEIAGQYAHKGKRVYVEGRLETRDWVGQDGVKRYRTEIVVSNLILLDGPRGTSPQGSAPAPQYTNESSAYPPQQPQEDEIKVEDIPF